MAHMTVGMHSPAYAIFRYHWAKDWNRCVTSQYVGPNIGQFRALHASSHNMMMSILSPACLISKIATGRAKLACITSLACA